MMLARDKNDWGGIVIIIVYRSEYMVGMSILASTTPICRVPLRMYKARNIDRL